MGPSWASLGPKCQVGPSWADLANIQAQHASTCANLKTESNEKPACKNWDPGALRPLLSSSVLTTLLEAQLDPILVPFWCQVGLSWGQVGPGWAKFSQAEPSWGQIGSNWRQAGAKWGLSWDQSGCIWALFLWGDGTELFGPSCGHTKIDPLWLKWEPKRWIETFH